MDGTEEQTLTLWLKHRDRARHDRQHVSQTKEKGFAPVLINPFACGMRQGHMPGYLFGLA